jgi:glucose-6-phosphate 1-dehydrogenase
MPMTHAGDAIRGEAGSKTRMVSEQDQLRSAEDRAQADPAVVAPPCAMVIFGAAGDLTKRLIVPALYNLVDAKRLPNEFQLVGVDLAAKTAEEWRRDSPMQ